MEPPVKEEIPNYGGDDEDVTMSSSGVTEAPDLSAMIVDGFLHFELGELGESDDEGLPTGKDDSGYWSNMFQGLSMNDWRQKVRTVLNKKPTVGQLGKIFMEAILSLKSALGTFARVHSNPERLPPGDEPTSSRDRAPTHGETLPLHPGLSCPPRLASPRRTSTGCGPS